MADFPMNQDPAVRYSELEQAYTEDRWSDVVQRGNALVQALAGSRDGQRRDLLSRAQLLIGHAQLYGLADARQARPHYQEVLATAEDPNLRQLAEKALQSCDDSLAAASASPSTASQSRLQTASEPPEKVRSEAAEEARGEGRPEPRSAEKPVAGAGAWPVAEPLAGSSAGGESFLEVVAAAQHPRPKEGSQPQATTPPWLAEASASSGTRPEVGLLEEVEVVEEPELVEVAQADPSQAEELELELTRIRERRQAARGASPETAPLRQAPTPVAPELASPKEDREDDLELLEEDLEEDPELVGSLLRVVLQG